MIEQSENEEILHQERLKAFERYRNYAEIIGARNLKHDKEEGRQCARYALWRYLSFPSTRLDYIGTKRLAAMITEEVVKSEHGLSSNRQARAYLNAKKWASRNDSVCSREYLESQFESSKLDTKFGSAVELAFMKREPSVAAAVDEYNRGISTMIYEKKANTTEILMEPITTVTGFTADDLRAKNREEPLSSVRHLAYNYFVRMNAPVSAVAKFMDRDRSTVIWSTKQHEGRLEVDRDYRETWEAILNV